MLQPKSVKEVQEAVNTASTAILIRGGGTKTALSSPSGNETVIDLSNLSGILEYRPEEFTFTALSGTPLENITEMLAENGQWMPFDPPMAKIGSTIGGTLATGLNGPGRYRFGGARDFILGIKWVSGVIGTLINEQSWGNHKNSFSCSHKFNSSSPSMMLAPSL